MRFVVSLLAILALSNVAKSDQASNSSDVDVIPIPYDISEEQDRQGGFNGIGNSPNQQTSCATYEGKPGSCRASCSTLEPNEPRYQCRTPGNFVPLICCPDTAGPAIYPPRIEGCGIRSQPIVGGHEAVPHSWPWQVALYQKSQNKPDGSFICGGSIISKRYVVTAAHCVVRMEGRLNADDFKVRVGAHQLSGSDGPKIAVEKVMAHENYRAHERYNDITLFRLAEDLPIGSNPAIRPVCLPQKDEVGREYTGSDMVVTGWGTTTFGGDLPDTLQEVDVPVVSNEECDQAYRDVQGSNVELRDGINYTMICAGAEGRDSCQGDSGGPMVYNDGNTNYVSYI